MRAALGEPGARACALAIDYGHWDASLRGCVAKVAERPGLSAEFRAQLLGGNTLALYGPRLEARLERTQRPRPRAARRFAEVAHVG